MLYPIENENERAKILLETKASNVYKVERMIPISIKSIEMTLRGGPGTVCSKVEFKGEFFVEDENPNLEEYGKKFVLVEVCSEHIRED